MVFQPINVITLTGAHTTIIVAVFTRVHTPPADREEITHFCLFVLQTGKYFPPIFTW